ncbi:insulinase family protein [Candidatus Accumulibacter phosphatis]|jgi:zinc protease|uniref:Insulinase family protein n=1 Tax=Candidatus Accumulibacter phosphatis TaxID=327160 RepID=A0ABX1TUH9_9PROT|nr:pitrilysin family protein [Candidatus Accumulibacter phosphatis]NMQ27103.1 insulinase family protein [Candidatus Accumulibacter phosphatis]
MRQTRLIPLLLALAAPVPGLAETFEQQLPNGLRVIVKEDRRAPTVVHMVWYRAGSMDETNGRTGVAHVLEHMMFKGTPNAGPGEFNRRVAAAGGRDNAFTSRDYTAYFQQVPEHKLAEMMQLEADRMRHLTLDPAEFAQEVRVVMEERRLRTEDQPQSLLFEQLTATAFQAHPYRVPIIGWMNDLENLAPADARRWYDNWYAPNNATVVVVGDVDHQAVFALATQHYGPLQARQLPVRKPQDEPPQLGTRRLSVKAPADLPLVMMAYKVPVIRHVEQDVDPYALEILGAILAGHDAARFSTSLVRRQQLAVEAEADYDSTARGPGIFYLRASPSEGKSVSELEAGLRAEIAAVQERAVSADELARAKAQLIAGQIYKLDSMFAQAMEIGQLEAVGIPYAQKRRLLEKLQEVTAAQVQTVARRYFSDQGLTVAELVPQPLPSAARSPAPARH